MAFFALLALAGVFMVEKGFETNKNISK